MGLRQKNSEYAYSKGREMRLDAEHEAYQISMPAPRTPPLFSHDATLQHYFEQGWKGVSQCDIRLHLGIAPSAVEQMISKTRRAQQCR